MYKKKLCVFSADVLIGARVQKRQGLDQRVRPIKKIRSNAAHTAGKNCGQKGRRLTASLFRPIAQNEGMELLERGLSGTRLTVSR